MKRRSIRGWMIAALLAAAIPVLRAEVKTEEKSQMKMEGMMGSMMGMFGGKAAKEGLVNTVAVKGNRKMTVSEERGEIIDLDGQKVYSLNMKKKSYEVITFDEMRRRLEEARKQAVESSGKGAGEESEPQMEFDFSLKESGQTRSISGYDCREVIMTISGHQKGKTLEEAGGMVIASHMWLGPEIPALKEIAEFDQRYARALNMIGGLVGGADQMAMAMAMYPGMKSMIGRMEAENVNLKGAQILTEMTMETVQNPSQASEKPKEESGDSGGASSLGGLGGMLGRRMSRKKDTQGEAAQTPGRAKIMTVNHELLKIYESVSPADLEIPAGFKEKK
jgi:hypothetical protein